MEALFIAGVCFSESDISVIWLILAIVWGIIIISSLFKGSKDDDDIQEYQEGKYIKLELIDTKLGLVVFTVNNQLISKVRKVHSTYGRLYFRYKNEKIYLSEFVPQRDGMLIII